MSRVVGGEPVKKLGVLAFIAAVAAVWLLLDDRLNGTMGNAAQQADLFLGHISTGNSALAYDLAADELHRRWTPRQFDEQTQSLGLHQHVAACWDQLDTADQFTTLTGDVILRDGTMRRIQIRLVRKNGALRVAEIERVPLSSSPAAPETAATAISATATAKAETADLAPAASTNRSSDIATVDLPPAELVERPGSTRPELDLSLTPDPMPTIRSPITSPQNAQPVSPLPDIPDFPTQASPAVEPLNPPEFSTETGNSDGGETLDSFALELMARRTLNDLRAALLADQRSSFALPADALSTFCASTAQRFQDNVTVDQMESMYTWLIDERSPALDIAERPILFLESPELDRDGQLTVHGEVEMTGGTSEFYLGYVREDSLWKLSLLRVLWREAPERAAEELLQVLGQDQLAVAYEDTHASLQNQVDESEFTSCVQHLRLDQFDSVTWQDTQVDGNIAALTGRISLRDGDQLQMRLHLARDRQGWQVYRLEQLGVVGL